MDEYSQWGDSRWSGMPHININGHRPVWTGPAFGQNPDSFMTISISPSPSPTPTLQTRMSPIPLVKKRSEFQIPWNEQFCWNGIQCKMRESTLRKCIRLHPNDDTCNCTEKYCKKNHNTKTGWSLHHDKDIEQKIIQREQKNKQSKQSKLHDTAFCVPPGINSVQVVINGESFDIGHETIGPLLGLLEDYGHTFPDVKKEGDGKKETSS